MMVLHSCNTLKYVPENERLLDHTSVQLTGMSVSGKDLKNRVRQQPNHRLWGVLGLDLALYNMSGRDTSKWINRALRNMGEAPVLFDTLAVGQTVASMERYLFSKGYFDAQVDSEVRTRKRRVRVNYRITPGEPYRIRSYSFQPEDSTSGLDALVSEALPSTGISSGRVFDSEELNEERGRLTQLARNQGYYAVGRDHFSFEVDSSLRSHQVDVSLQIEPYIRIRPEGPSQEEHRAYEIGRVYFLLDVPTSAYSRSSNAFLLADYDTIQLGGYCFIYRDKPLLLPGTLLQNCFVTPGALYRADDVDRTYARLNRMSCLRYVNIRFLERPDKDPQTGLLDCYISLTPAEENILTIDLEGTNTAGDLGVASNLSYTQQNLFRGGEVYNVSLRGAYEALSGSYTNDYFEYGGEMSLELPNFRLPLLSRNLRKEIDASTNFSISYDNLSRPEFLRTTASASLRYTWQNQLTRHTLTPIDFAYVYMPRVDSAFKATYLREGSYLRYSYEDQFILEMAYGFMYSSQPQGLSLNNQRFYTLRVNIEEAGNLLNPISHRFGEPNDNGQYTLGRIPYSQFLKGEVEYTQHIPLNSTNRIALRVGLGMAYPYGNSKILPFEKRFYSGGANSVRGWSVRTLGPGRYKTALRTIDFMNQSGDMKLDLNFEFRQKWFWVLEGAYFIDAGNIWTLRAYDNQPGGQFRAESFLEEIAMSAGLGIRLDFKFVLFRVDLGMKVYDPAGLDTDERWRIRHIHSTDDFAFHMAIGYPF